MTRAVAAAHGIYYVVTGVWPILSLGTFEAVSGPKTEDWLVRTVGVVLTIVGLTLISAALKNDLGAPVRVLAIGSAASLAFVDFFYALRGVIWPIYMLDGVGEVLLIAMWAAALIRDRGTARQQVRMP